MCGAFRRGQLSAARRLHITPARLHDNSRKPRRHLGGRARDFEQEERLSAIPGSQPAVELTRVVEPQPIWKVRRPSKAARDDVHVAAEVGGEYGIECQALGLIAVIA